MLDNIEVLYHSSIRIKRDLVIYFDPFKINKEYNDADIIFITHNHYDHYSPEDIKKVRKKDTVVVAPIDLLDDLLLLLFVKESIILVKPDEKYNVKGIGFKTIRAYNINKNFHLKEYNWVGYLVTIKDIIYYIAGDTDVTAENKQVKCDVAFVPVGGTYTMDYKEAAKFVNEIKPKIAVPTHYGEVVGSKEDGKNFSRLLNSNIKYKIYIE